MQAHCRNGGDGCAGQLVLIVKQRQEFFDFSFRVLTIAFCPFGDIDARLDGVDVKNAFGVGDKGCRASV